MQGFGVKLIYCHRQAECIYLQVLFYSILYGAEIRVTIETKPYLNYLFKVTELRVSFAN